MTPRAHRRKSLAGNLVVGVPLRFDHGDVCLGRRPFFLTFIIRRRTPWKSMSSANSGCGKFSIRRVKAEINELHVPAGRPVKLIMTSEDVIHDFFCRPFASKKTCSRDVIRRSGSKQPRPASINCFASQYCGTQHSGMIGRIMSWNRREFETWLSGGATGMSLADVRARIFSKDWAVKPAIVPAAPTRVRTSDRGLRKNRQAAGRRYGHRRRELHP